MIKTLTCWLCLNIIFLCSAVGQGKNEVFEITPENTTIEFKAKHFWVVNVSGTFKSFSGQITISDEVITDGKILLDVNSIYTANNSRDRSLRDKEFLDAKGHPQITVRFIKNNRPDLISSLVSIKRKTISIPISYELGTMTLGTRSIRASCEISREQFNLSFGNMDDLVSDKVKISAFVTLKAK